MVQNEKIKNLIQEVLDDDILLYDVTWHQEGKNSILQVAIMHSDGSMDLDTCASVSEKISTKLDEVDLITHEYFLEVCSPGAERELKNEDQIKDAVGNYVYVKFKNPKAGLSDVKGTLLEMSDSAIRIEYMDKAVRKKVDVDLDNISLIRLSVKI